MGKVHRCGVESTAAILRHPLHPMLVPFPIAALVGALAADLVFLFVWSGFWADVASYLVLAGLASGLLAGAVGAVDMLSTSAVRRLAVARVHGLGNVAALGLAAIVLAGWIAATDRRAWMRWLRSRPHAMR